MADTADHPTVEDSSAEAEAGIADTMTGGEFGGALAGVAAAGAALGTGELLSGLSEQIPSLVIAVGEFMVDETPGAIARWSIDQFGSNQKTILVWGISIVSLLVGGGLGRAAWKRYRSSRSTGLAVGAIIFALFAVLGGLAAARVPQSSAGLAWLSALLSALTGFTVLAVLLKSLAQRRAVATDQSEAIAPQARRGFVGLLAGTGVAAVIATFLGGRLRGRYAVEDAREIVAEQLNSASPVTAPADDTVADQTAPDETATDTATGGVMAGVEDLDDEVDGISPFFVPNDDFYRIDAALVVPQVNPANWSLSITGMVDNELTFTFDDLLARATVEEAVTLSCVSNPVGGELVGNALWLGVPLRELLDEAGVQPGASQIVGRSVDNWTGGFPTAHLDDPETVALLAVGMNGEPLPVIHGFPARLVIAGLYGYVSATKWIEEIHLTTLEDFNGYWIDRGWSKLGPIKTQSRIDVPKASDHRNLNAGIQPIAGVAWAPGRSIAKVEVQIDDEPWATADLPEELSENAWRQWVYYWDATPGKHTISVRATDGDGDTQTVERSSPAPSGATGHHAIDVTVKGV